MRLCWIVTIVVSPIINRETVGTYLKRRADRGEYLWAWGSQSIFPLRFSEDDGLAADHPPSKPAIRRPGYILFTNVFPEVPPCKNKSGVSLRNCV